ncbi:GNAT family N-acetyltransferase [Mycoplasmatota bacterium]|nr:GNAT family N-acetyltransferase [Mycoplasmatota bacterium]
MKTLMTNRLILRAFNNNDAEDVYDYAKRDDVGPLAGWSPHSDISETISIINNFIEKDEVYAIFLKEKNIVIGSLGIHYTSLGSIGDVYELGYVLHPDYHRKGIMTEAVHAALDDFFFNQNKDEIYVGHFFENEPSRKLIEKIGFEFVEDINYQSKDYGEKETKIYKLTKLNYVLNKGE